MIAQLGQGAGLAVYLGIFVAAVVEGEVVFVAATVLVQMGKLNGLGVYAAAALGGSVGDQLYFYFLRGRLGWLDRFPTWSRRRDLVVGRVRQNASAMIFACRFLPGLRVAIPAACAYAEVRPLQFSGLSLLSSFTWAAAIMGLIAWLGPASFAELGIRAWWTPLVPAGLVLGFTYWLGRQPALAGTSLASSPNPLAPANEE
ncbi:MAG TPA: VTT domain-containing protein [Vicinamibacteria bacterium]|nr:VTT domain-containing protein [Vicinamibacteria bacterium]